MNSRPNFSICAWITLFDNFIGNYTSIENDRKFRSFLGIPPFIAERIFVKYYHPRELKTRFKLMVLIIIIYISKDF